VRQYACPLVIRHHDGLLLGPYPIARQTVKGSVFGIGFDRVIPVAWLPHAGLESGLVFVIVDINKVPIGGEQFAQYLTVFVNNRQD